MNNKVVLDLLKYTLTDNENKKLSSYSDISEIANWNEVYDCFYNHAILPMTFELNRFLPDECVFRKSWKDSVYSNVFIYTNLLKCQTHIINEFSLNHIPVAVIKGTSAAKYYPKPQFRTMGDIDLLVKPNNFEQAVQCLIKIGCKEITGENEVARGRHRSFQYRDVTIELHHYFSLFVDENKASILDEMLFRAITSSCTELPDDENGLVLLSHIRQHLEDGLGLRQIIDWFMFVRAYLNDEKWNASFQKKLI